MNVAISTDAPVDASRATKASLPPLMADWNPPTTGKFEEIVVPVTHTAPPEPMASPLTWSSELPPRNVDQARDAPSDANFVMNPSDIPPDDAWAAEAVGNPEDDVYPATMGASPDATATASASSPPLLPRYVHHVIAEPVAVM